MSADKQIWMTRVLFIFINLYYLLMMKYFKSVLVAFVLLTGFFPSVGQIDTIITVAGNGINGDLGDGGLAIYAEIGASSNVVFDADGNCYFSQNDKNRIRKIASSGIISNFAGTGIAGYSGDGGRAISSNLDYPVGIAVDNSNNLYVADLDNNVIRKIDISSGVISTYAGNGLPLENGDGGLAIDASIYAPVELFCDQRGNLFISDQDNKIRKVDAGSHIISTVAGRGGATGFSGDGGPATMAQLNGPHGICLDSIGNLFIADYYNDRIRKVDAATGIITTVAGGALGTYNGEGIPATDAQLNPWQLKFDYNGMLYIADSHNWRVRRIDNRGMIYTVAGIGVQGYSGDCGPASSAELSSPFGLGFDSLNNLYINDEGTDFRIRKVTTNPHCSALSLSVFENNPNFSVFPNPAQDELTIRAIEKIQHLSVINIYGNTVLYKYCNKNEESVKVANLKQGVYFVKVAIEYGDVYISRFVKE